MDKTHSKRPKVFYGYWMAMAAFWLVFIFSGCGFFAFSLFVKPLEADLGWSRGEIMAAFTTLSLTLGVVSPFIGKLVDHYGVKKVIFIGALVGGLGSVLSSLVNNLWQFYISYAIVGVGLAAAGIVPASTIVSNWFKKRRGLAIGIMSAGSGTGGLVLAPVIGGYLIPNFGWRASYLALAIIMWVILLPLASFVIKAKPADMGLHPDGVEAHETVTTAEGSPVLDGLTLKMALATPAFWLIAVAFLLAAFSHVGTVENQVPHLEDLGFPIATVAASLGGAALGSAVGKFLFGYLCDCMPAKYACSIGLGLQAVAIIVFLNIQPASPVAIIGLYAIVMGLGMGSWLPTMSILTSANFKLASYGTIFGLIYFIQSVGSATGPLMAGYLYDVMNTYHWALVIFLSLYAVSIPCILLVRPPKSL